MLKIFTALLAIIVIGLAIVGAVTLFFLAVAIQDDMVQEENRKESNENTDKDGTL